MLFIFEAFRLTLVKNRQNGKRRKITAIYKKKRAVIGRKEYQWERIISVQSLRYTRRKNILIKAIFKF